MDADKPTLKPCPFCGQSNPDLDGEAVTGDMAAFVVMCWNCGATGGKRDNRDDAAEAWNQRSESKGE